MTYKEHRNIMIIGSIVGAIIGFVWIFFVWIFVITSGDFFAILRSAISNAVLFAILGFSILVIFKISRVFIIGGFKFIFGAFIDEFDDSLLENELLGVTSIPYLGVVIEFLVKGTMSVTGFFVGFLGELAGMGSFMASLVFAIVRMMIWAYAGAVIVAVLVFASPIITIVRHFRLKKEYQNI